MAAVMRGIYGMFSHVERAPNWQPGLHAVWHGSSGLGTNEIMSLAAIHLGFAATLFLATAFSPADRQTPALIEERIVATKLLASAEAGLGMLAFLLILPDAARSSAPAPMIVLCLGTAGISAVLAAINGPRAIEHERWASAAEAKRQLITQTIEGLRKEGALLPHRTCPQFLRSLSSRLPKTSVGTAIHLRMILAVHWQNLLAPLMVLIGITAAIGILTNPAIGAFSATAAVLTVVIAVATTLTTANSPRVDGSHPRWYPPGLVAMCLLMPSVIALTFNMAAATAFATTIADMVILGFATFAEIGLAWWSFRIIALDPRWILGGLMILEDRAVRDEQRHLTLATLQRRPHLREP